jgi:hypothetical protein
MSEPFAENLFVSESLLEQSVHGFKVDERLIEIEGEHVGFADAPFDLAFAGG